MSLAFEVLPEYFEARWRVLLHGLRMSTGRLHWPFSRSILVSCVPDEETEWEWTTWRRYG